jgi:ZIP family zinc transporter
LVSDSLGLAILSVVILSVAIGTSLATLLGGLAALRFRELLHLILAFSAGTVVALAFFDLLPEALRLGRITSSSETILAIAAAGFFVYAILDRLVLLNGSDPEGAHAVHRGWAGAGSLSAHSFVDGLALGIGFQASTSIGIVVAVAILAHDCSDGMNTVSIVLRNSGTRRAAFGWLIADAIAPLAGAATSLSFHPTREQLALVLAGFAGFFLYIGASDLLPESFRAGSRITTTAALLVGAATLYAVVRIAG